MTTRRSKAHKGVLRRCTCPERSARCTHWSFQVELPAKDGRRRQVSQSGFATPTEAAEARDKLIGQHREGTLPIDDKITVGEWVRSWLDRRIAAGELRPSTARSYSDLAEHHLLPKVGDVRLAKLKAHHLTAAYREIVADRNAERAEIEAKNAKWLKANPGSTRPYAVLRPISPATIRRIHAVASGALTSAVKGGLLAANPASGAELPKASRVKLEPWTAAHYGRFLDAVREHRLHVAFHLTGHTGLRRGELAGLTWDDVDLVNARLTVRQTRVSVGYAVHEGGTKSDAGQDRIIPLDAGTVEILKFHRLSQDVERHDAGPAYADGGHVIADELGAPVHPETISKAFRRLAERAGLPPTKFHGLRHFFAWALISSGRSPGEVMYLMGHADLRTTLGIYGGLFERAARDATEGVAALVRDARVDSLTDSLTDGRSE